MLRLFGLFFIVLVVNAVVKLGVVVQLVLAVNLLHFGLKLDRVLGS